MRGVDTWLESLGIYGADEGGDGGQPATGRDNFLREVFDAHGSVSPRTLRELWHDRERMLVTRAVALLEADLRRTTDLTPRIEVILLEDGVVAATYNGSYATPVISSITEPASVCEVADNLRDQVVDDLRTVWPVCPRDGLGLDPRVIEGRSVWHCRVGDHVADKIGQLRPAS